MNPSPTLRRFVATLAAVAVVVAVGFLTRANSLGHASSYEAALPEDPSRLPGRRMCATWFLDAASDGATGSVLPLADGAFHIARGHVLDLSGWAVIDGNHAEPRAMFWRWDREREQVVMYPLKREDVAAKAHDPSRLFSGFFAPLETRGRALGLHRLTFFLVPSDAGSACWDDRPIMVVIT